MIDLRQTPQYKKYMQVSNWDVASFKGQNVFIKKVPLLGALAKLQRPVKRLDTNAVQDFINEQKISIFSIEPVTDIPLLLNFSYAKSPYLPSKTITLDLKQSEKELLKNMKQKTRYNIKMAEKKNVFIVKSFEIDLFVEEWQKAAAKRGQFLPQQKEIKNLFLSLGENAHLYFAYQKNKMLGGLLVLDSQDTAYYMYAFANEQGRKLFTPTLLTWQAIKEAKERKLKVFDFDGIYDARYPQTTKHWQGFTKFKEGFGGKVVEFPKTQIWYKNPILKLLNI